MAPSDGAPVQTFVHGPSALLSLSHCYASPRYITGCPVPLVQMAATCKKRACGRSATLSPVAPGPAPRSAFDAFYADLDDNIAGGLTLLEMDSVRRTSRAAERWAFGCMARLRTLACGDLRGVLQCAALMEQCKVLRNLSLHDHRTPTPRLIEVITGVVLRNAATLRHLCVMSGTYQTASSAPFGAALGACAALQTVQVDGFDGHTYDAFLLALQRRTAAPASEEGGPRCGSALRVLKWEAEQPVDAHMGAALYATGARLEAAAVHSLADLSGVTAHPIRRLRLRLLGTDQLASNTFDALRPTLTTLTLESFWSAPAPRPMEPVDLPPTLTRLFMRGRMSNLVTRAPGLRALEMWHTAAGRDHLPLLLKSLADPRSLQELRLVGVAAVTRGTLDTLAALAPGLLRLRLDNIDLPLVAQFAADALAAREAEPGLGPGPWPLLAEFACTLVAGGGQPSNAVSDGVERYLRLWPCLASLQLVRAVVCSVRRPDEWIEGAEAFMHTPLVDAIAVHTCGASGTARDAPQPSASAPSPALASVVNGLPPTAGEPRCAAPLRRLAVTSTLWTRTTSRTAHLYLGALSDLCVYSLTASDGIQLLQLVLELACRSLVALGVVKTLPPPAHALANLPVLSALRYLHLPWYSSASARALVAAAPQLRHLALYCTLQASLPLLLEDSKALARLETLNYQGDLTRQEAAEWRRLAAHVPAAARGYTWQRITKHNDRSLAPHP